MSSERKIAANRVNAQKSCGPRTRAGKARTSCNALRHGLAAITHRNPVLFARAERMAKAFCGDDNNPLLFEQAMIIAENVILLHRIRSEVVAIIGRSRKKNLVCNSVSTKDLVDIDAMRGAMHQLERLDRYEVRAWSRRKRAIRAFIEIKLRS